jgi:pimeloyl-ACP methyl ester carboxylesterase
VTTEAMMVLEDVAAGSAQSRLKATTPTPTSFEIEYRVDGRPGRGNLYHPNQPVGGNLVLVPGFTPHGKDDRRVVEFAQSFARARFRVLVPDVPGPRLMRVAVDDARVIADAAFHISNRYPVRSRTQTALLAISYAVGPAVLATLDPRLQDHVDFVVGIGGYHDTTAVTRFVTGGHFREPDSASWQKAEPHPAAKWFFLKSNIDRLEFPDDRAALMEMADRKINTPAAPSEDLVARLGPQGHSLYRLMENTDPDRVAGLIDALPDPVKLHLSGLSLKQRNLDHLSGRLILVHGREDRMIPFTESVALANTVPNTELFVITGFSHINARDVGAIGQAKLTWAVQKILERRHPTNAD